MPVRRERRVPPEPGDPRPPRILGAAEHLRAKISAPRTPQEAASVDGANRAKAVAYFVLSSWISLSIDLSHEAQIKMRALADLIGDERARSVEWHLIGPLQSNKTSIVARCFDWVHTVDRAKIAHRLSDARPQGTARLNVLLQVNISGEATSSLRSSAMTSPTKYGSPQLANATYGPRSNTRISAVSSRRLSRAAQDAPPATPPPPVASGNARVLRLNGLKRTGLKKRTDCHVNDAT